MTCWQYQKALTEAPRWAQLARYCPTTAVATRPGLKQWHAQVTASDLLAVPEGPRTEATLRTNCTVGVQYLEAWLGGLGCVPLDNLMEDAATAEICRTQVLTVPGSGVQSGLSGTGLGIRVLFPWNCLKEDAATAEISRTQVR